MSEPVVSHRWRPLEDLSSTDRDAASDELVVLARTWREQKAQLDARQVQDFNERLHREWAIETGIIEHVYTLDRGTTHLLIEHGIDASLIPNGAPNQSPELVAGIITDQKQAVEWLFDLVTKEQPVAVSFIKQLHALMTRRQEWVDGVDQFGRPTKARLEHGEYKSEPNNPTRPDGHIHEYCPPLQVSPEMERLVALHQQHTLDGVPPEVEAAWLHHRFTQIHPFQDGNGRLARALASLVFIREDWFPLVVTRDDRSTYIDALESADTGDLSPLVRLFTSIQRRSFLSGLSIAEQVRREHERVDQLIEAIGEMYAARDRVNQVQMEKAKDIAHQMWAFADERVAAICSELMQRLGRDDGPQRLFRHDASGPGGEQRHYHRYQVVQTAGDLDYFANIGELHEWSRLLFQTENGRAELLVSFHGVGQDYRGVVGVSVTFFRRQAADDIEDQIVELMPASDEVFQINYNDDAASVERRFRPWLETALLRGLDLWRRGE